MTCTRPQAESQKRSLDPWAPSTHDPQLTPSATLSWAPSYPRPRSSSNNRWVERRSRLLGLVAADHLAHRRARHRQRAHDLLDGAMLLKIGAPYLTDQVHANHPHKPSRPIGPKERMLTQGVRRGRNWTRNRPSGGRTKSVARRSGTAPCSEPRSAQHQGSAHSVSRPNYGEP